MHGGIFFFFRHKITLYSDFLIRSCHCLVSKEQIDVDDQFDPLVVFGYEFSNLSMKKTMYIIQQKGTS